MATLNKTFTEQQKFNQLGLWVLLAAIYLSPFILKLKSIVNDGFFETFSTGIFAHLGTLGAIIILFALLRLDTKIDKKSIQIYFFPFFKKEFLWKDIQEIQVVKYSFSEVMGWGIRIGTPYGRVYSTRGFYGVFFAMKNGKKYMIGTQKPEKIKNFIKNNS